MDPSKSSEKSGFQQPTPPPYSDNPGYPNAGYPNAGYPPAGIYPNPSGYPGQPIPPAQYGQGPYPGQQPITVQPTVYLTPTPLAKPLPDYLGYSIFTMLCCCLPLGVAALVYSIFTRNANVSGQQQIAEKNSKMARTLNHAALGIGLAFIVIYIIIVVVTVVRKH